MLSLSWTLTTVAVLAAQPMMMAKSWNDDRSWPPKSLARLSTSYAILSNKALQLIVQRKLRLLDARLQVAHLERLARGAPAAGPAVVAAPVEHLPIPQPRVLAAMLTTCCGPKPTPPSPWRLRYHAMLSSRIEADLEANARSIQPSLSKSAAATLVA